MKITITLLIAIYCFCAVPAQNQYSCNGHFSIKLPTILELQSSELNNIKIINAQGKSQQIEISTPSNRIVFQQKGLNANVKSAYNKYCRVIVEYYKNNGKEPVYGRGDQILVDRDMLYAIHSSVKEACIINKTPLIKLSTIQPLDINGFPVLFYSYKRKGWEGKQPPVIVNVYLIFNRYESVTLTFSYREAEREIWKNIHNNITKTFNFTKKY